MNIQLPPILAKISGTMIVVFGLVYILVTFNSRGVGPMGALVFMITGIAIVAAGVMNLVNAYGGIGRRWVIAANAIGLFCFTAAAFLTKARSAFVGLLLFAFVSICSWFVIGLDHRSGRSYPNRL